MILTALVVSTTPRQNATQRTYNEMHSLIYFQLHPFRRQQGNEKQLTPEDWKLSIECTHVLSIQSTQNKQSHKEMRLLAFDGTSLNDFRNMTNRGPPAGIIIDFKF